MKKIVEALNVCSKNDFTAQTFCGECPYCKNGCSEALSQDIAKLVGIKEPRALSDCTIEQLKEVLVTKKAPPRPKKVRRKMYDSFGQYYYTDEAV